MGVTIKQIAQLAGVSRGTVDRALNHRGGVNSQVEARINELARELCYEPNPMAKALATSKKKLRISAIINSGGNPFFALVLAGLNRASQEYSKYGVRTTLCELTGYDVELQCKAIEELAKSPPEGLIITPINNKRIIKALGALAEKGTAIVTLTADVTGLSKLCFVGCDYYRSGQTAGELMGKLAKGAKSVGIITGSLQMLGHKQRVDGFCEVLKKSYPEMRLAGVLEGNDSDEQTYRVTKGLLKTDQPEALYFCAGGIDGGIRAVKEHDKPITVITVDNAGNISEYLNVGLVQATVCQQPYKQGYDAILRLSDYLVNQKKPPRKHLYTHNEIQMRYNCE